jgi:hypothetical protein
VCNVEVTELLTVVNLFFKDFDSYIHSAVLLWIFDQCFVLFNWCNVLQQERLEKEAEIRRVREQLIREQASQKDSSYWVQT